MFPYTPDQYAEKHTMDLPICVEGANRTDRSCQMTEMKAAGVDPALFGFDIGHLIKKGISLANQLANG